MVLWSCGRLKDFQENYAIRKDFKEFQDAFTGFHGDFRGLSRELQGISEGIQGISWRFNGFPGGFRADIQGIERRGNEMVAFLRLFQLASISEIQVKLEAF